MSPTVGGSVLRFVCSGWGCGAVGWWESGFRKAVLVGPVGLEPTRFGLKVRCSANWSYRPVWAGYPSLWFPVLWLGGVTLAFARGRVES